MTSTSRLPENGLNIPAPVGELLAEYCEGMTEDQISLILDADSHLTHEILESAHPISPLMCLRLAHYFDTSYDFWANVQRNYENSLLAHVETLVKEDMDSIRNRFSIVLDPDMTDTTWKYHMVGEYKFSEGRGYNSLPIRIKLSGLVILSFDQAPQKATTDEYQVWYHNMWVLPIELPSNISILMSERRVSDTQMTER